MKRLSLIPVCMLMLLVFLPSFTNVSGYTPPTDFTGTSPPIEPGQSWSLGVTDGWVSAGDVIQWHWNASDSVTFTVFYTVPSDLHTVQIAGLQMDDGIVAPETGWYGLGWLNTGTSVVTVDYIVDVYTPVIKTNSIKDGSYVNTRTLVVSGATEGLATGVLVGTNALNLHKANLTGSNWSGTVALAEGRNTIIMQSYYWLQPSGANNFTLTRTVNVTLDTVAPSVSIVSPSSGTYIRGRAVQVYWNCSDNVGLMKVDMKVDNGPWVTVSWGDMLGLGYTQIGLPTGKHFIQVRATDRAGNYYTAFTAVYMNSDDWSLRGPMYGLPTIGIIFAVVVLSLVAYFVYAAPRPDDQPPPAPVDQPPPAPVEPPAEPKDQSPPQQG